MMVFFIVIFNKKKMQLNMNTYFLNVKSNILKSLTIVKYLTDYPCNAYINDKYFGYLIADNVVKKYA